MGRAKPSRASPASVGNDGPPVGGYADLRGPVVTYPTIKQDSARMFDSRPVHDVTVVVVGSAW